MTRRILGVLLAIVLAVAGTAAVLLYVDGVRNSVADGQAAVTVLVAKQRIPAGTSGAALKELDLLDELVMPAATVPEGTLATIADELDDLVLTHDLHPQQLVRKAMFGAVSNLSGGISVPDKMLAVSLKLAVEEEVGGFVRPGSQISVFATFKLLDKKFKDDFDEDNYGTMLLLPRVDVLAVGAYGQDGVTSSGSETTAETKPTGTVTLLVTVSVTQADAEKLIHAVRIADLYLALLTASSEVRPGGMIDNRNILK